MSVIFQNISLSQNFARMNDVLLIIFKVNYSKIIPSNIIMTSQDQYFLKLFIYITYIIDILYFEETIQGYWQLDENLDTNWRMYWRVSYFEGYSYAV